MYFMHKKAKKLVELKSQENGVVVLVEHGKDEEKQMKTGLFAKLFTQVTDEEVAEYVEAQKKSLDEKIEKKIKNTANVAKKAKAAKELYENTETFKALVDKHLAVNEYTLDITGQEIHRMVIRNEGVTLEYSSHVKMNHKGISRTVFAFNGRVIPEYRNIGIDTIAEDFASEIGLSVEDLRDLMMTVRRCMIAANRETFTLAQVEAQKAEHNENMQAARTARLKRAQEKVREKAALAKANAEASEA